MANFFDRFDEPAPEANFFDRFDEPAPEANFFDRFDEPEKPEAAAPLAPQPEPSRDAPRGYIRPERGRPPEGIGPSGEDPWDLARERAEQTNARRGEVSDAVGRGFGIFSPIARAGAAVGQTFAEDPVSAAEGATRAAEDVPERFGMGIGGNRMLLGEMGVETSEEWADQVSSQPNLLFSPENRRTSDAFRRWAVERGLMDPETQDLADDPELALEIAKTLTPEQRADLASFISEPFEQQAEAGRDQYERNRAEMVGPPTENPWTPGSITYNIAGSTVEMMPGLIASLFLRSPAPAMASIAAQVGGHSYGEARTEHELPPEIAREYSTLMAAAEGVTEWIPVSRLLKPGSSLTRRMTEAGVTESVQEGVTEAIQFALDKGYVSPDTPWSEAWEKIAYAMTVGTGAGVTLATATHPAVALGERARRRQREAPNLKPGDAESPIPDEVLSRGNDVLDAVDRRETPRRPQQPLAPAPTPDVSAARRALDDLPRRGTEPVPETPRFEIMDETETVDGESRPTGRKVRVNLDTGQAEVVPEGTPAAPERPQGGEATLPQVETAERQEGAPAPAVEPTSVVEAVSDETDDRPILPESEPSPPPEGVRPTPREIEILDNEAIRQVETDPETFQYKSGADAEGVTDRLRGIEQWDDRRAGVGVVYEYRDGRRVIVDGHQRLGLAKRSVEAGQAVNLPVHVLREADGYTVAQARAIGAEKNIAEGSGTALDAAKVFRDTRMTAKDLNLPPSSQLVRDGDALRRLSDNAFGMVTNEVASERDGAIVGRLVEDAERHSDILGLLSRLRPANRTQAEAIVRQAAETEVRETQETLFGEEEVSANLYLERAKVLDRAIKTLGRDIQTFRTLTERGDTIAEAGNVLAEDENAARLDAGARARAALMKQANTKGPISDALTEAARALKEGASVAGAARQFIAAVRRGEGVGEAGGAPAGGPRGSDERPGQGRPTAGAAEEVAPQTEQTPEGEQTLTPGVAPITQEDRERAALRRGQDAPMRGRDEGPRSGRDDLFGDPSERADLFDQPAAPTSGGEGTPGPAEDGRPAPEPEAVESQEPAADETQARARADRIEDFGEQIAGAAKDRWRAYADKIAEVADDEIAGTPLSRSFPAPDYEALIEDGVDPWTVSFIRAARDMIPNKPRGWKLKGWVGQVAALRQFSNDLLSGTISRERVQERLSQPEFSRLRDKIMGSIDLYAAVGHGQSLKGLSLEQSAYTMKDGQQYDPPLRVWEVTKAARKTAFSNMPRVLAEGDTKEAAIDAFRGKIGTLDTATERKADRKIRFDIFVRKGGEAFIGKKIGRNRVELETFPDVKAARQYLDEHYDDLVAKIERMKDIPSERRTTNSPRVGTDYRSGADVTPEQFSETFGFRGVQFGNYVEGGRRQQDLNEAYDGLMDLAGVLGVDPRALSLNGELGLAFGARGKGGKNAAAAHYEANQIVINLTKTSGAGSLAHEWFHALDNYFERSRGRATAFVTDTPSPRPMAEAADVRPEVLQALRDVRQAINQTSLKRRSENLDRVRTKPYWTTGIEMHARAFESYVIAKLNELGASNDYLANVVGEDAFRAQAVLQGLPAESYPYPTPAEVPAIRAGFDGLFQTIETKETDRGMAMFARSRGKGESDWRKQLEDLLAGKIENERFLSLGPVPEIIRHFGGRGRDLVIGAGKLSTVLKTRGKLVGRAIMDLPDLVANPVMVLTNRGDRRTGDLMFITDEIAANGDPIVAIIKNRAQTGFGQSTAMVVTVFPKDRIADLIDSAARRGDIRYLRAAREDDGFKHLGGSFTVDTPPWAAPVARLRADPKIATPRTVFKSGEPPRFRRDRRATETPEFRRWFGDSKVVDANGEPLVVYHGTNADIEAFDPARGGETTGAPSARMGFFFSASPEVASSYAEAINFYEDQPILRFINRVTRGAYERANEALIRRFGKSGIVSGGNVIPSYLSLKDPLVIDQGGREYRDKSYAEIIQQAKSDGHDGVIIRNTFDPGFESGLAENAGDVLTDIFVAFRPEQIKSAHNRGTFDPDDPRISFRRSRDSVDHQPTSDVTDGAVRYQTTAAAREKLPAVMAAVQARLRDLNLSGIETRVAERLFGRLPNGEWVPVSGAAVDGVISVALNRDRSLGRTIDHEAVHILRGLGVFRPAEWRALEKEARRRLATDEALRRDIEENYGGFPEELQVEEVIADMFAEWSAGRQQHRGFIRAAFERIHAVLDAIGSALRGEGFTTVEQVFQRVESGQVGRRQGGAVSRTADGRFAAAWHGSPTAHEGQWSTDYIGTGEGAQAYGWGLYFAQRREIADFYREQEARRRSQIIVDGKLVDAGRKNMTNRNARERAAVIAHSALEDGQTMATAVLRARNALRQAESGDITQFQREGGWGDVEVLREALEILKGWQDRDVKLGRGRLFQVEVPETDELLVWDTPLSEQPEKVQRALDDLMGETEEALQEMADTMDISYDPDALTGRDLYRMIGHALERDMLPINGPGVEAALEQGNRDQAASLYLKNEDIPGHRFLDNTSRDDGTGTYNYVVYDGSAVQTTGMFAVQRRTRMQGGAHIPDRAVWTELTTANRGVWGRLKGAGAATHDAVDRARIIVQDRFLPVLRAQEAVVRSTGEPIPEEANAYIAEETFSGKVGRHLFEIDEEYTKPIIDMIAETEGDLTVDTVGEWLTARHAEERNVRIAQINEDMPDGGSGMKTADAQRILRDAANGPHADRLENIGALVDRLRDRTLRLREESGLLSPEEARIWRNQYDHYVPLKGFAETDHAEAYLDATGTGRRFNTRGQEEKRALGRSSEAFNPLQAIFTQAQEVAIRAEKNRVGQALFRLVESNPSPMWEVKTPQQKRFFNKTTGLVETRTESDVTLFMDPNEMAVKIDGKERRIVFHDSRLARAAGSVGADQMGAIVRMGMAFSRWFSAVNTMMNPEFVVTNAFRDMTAAQVNIRNFGGEDRQKLARAMIRNWPRAFKAAYRGQLNKADDEWTRFYREYEESGAKVAFWHMDQPEAGRSDLERRIRQKGGNVAQRASRFASLSTRDNPILGFIERTNLAVDNAIRLAAYVESRQIGWSKGQAASLSKNMTVNFNRRGEIGASINAFYPFFNAAIQGTQILFRAAHHKRVRRIMLGMVAAGVLEDQVNAWLSAEDDDEELAWDKVPDHKQRRNLMLMLPDRENPISVPLPYGYNVFPYAGKQLSKMARGVKSGGEVLPDFLATAFESISPISGQTFQETVTPTALQPIVEVSFNKDWLGRPIRPEDPYSDYGPEAYKHYPSVSEVSRLMADALNRATGGSRAESGLIDVSPEYIDHLTGFATGGAGRFVGRTTDLAAKIAIGDTDDITASDVPFARLLRYNTGDWLDRDRYYRFRDEVREASEAVEVARELREPVSEETRNLARLSGDMKIVEKRLSRLRKERKALDANSRISAEARGERKDRAYSAEHDVMLKFNRRFVRTMGPQGE